VYTYDVSTGDEAVLTKQFTFTVTLVDPCDPPTSVQVVALTDQVYTITDTNVAPYLHPDFVISPAYCPLAYTYDLGAISSVSVPSAVTRVDKTFSFSYSQDLQPLGNT